MIEFKELYLQNFRSWGELHLTNLDSKGLCAIQGNNGSGKSSVKQAIEYLLVDDISDGFPLDEIPKDTNSQCMIGCWLIVDGRDVSITKYRNHKKLGNSIKLLVDGENLSFSDRRDTQRKIEELLGINKGVLFASTIFSQNSLSFPECKESERKNILYDALSLHQYNEYLDLAKKKRDKLNNRVSLIENEMTMAETMLLDISKESAELVTLENTYESNKLREIKQCNEELSTLYNSFESLVSGEEVDSCLSVMESLEKRTKLADSIVYEIGILRHSLLQIDSGLKDLNKEKESIQNSICPILKEKCETLFQKNSTAVEVIDKRIAELVGTRLNLLTDMADKQQALSEYSEDVKIYNDTKKRKEEAERRMTGMEKRNAVIQANIESKTKILEGLKSSKGNPYTEQFEKLEKKKSSWEVRRYSLEEELIKMKDDLSYTEFWVNGFGKSGIPNMKVEGFLSSLEDRTNYYLSQLTDRMTVSISPIKELKSGNAREAISYTINAKDSEVHDYHSFSGGEKQRIKLADLLAFSSLLGKFNIMVLDEVLELSLDENGKSDVIDLLKMKISELGSVFVITHSDVMKDKIDNIIKVRKVNGQSSIE